MCLDGFNEYLIRFKILFEQLSCCCFVDRASFNLRHLVIAEFESFILHSCKSCPISVPVKPLEVSPKAFYIPSIILKSNFL